MSPLRKILEFTAIPPFFVVFCTVSNNYSSYPSNPSSDSHPTQAGNQKAAGEFIALLNYWYHRWQTP